MSYSKPPKPATQVGGDHYSRLGVEPIQFIETNNLGYHEGNVVKYVSRWRNKNGIEDLKKAKWYIERLLELEESKVTVTHTKADCEEVTPEEQMFWDAASYFTKVRPDGRVLAYVDYDVNNQPVGVNAFINGQDEDSTSFRKSDCEYFAGLYRKAHG